jgi:large-conductance mechanosensitive channel
VPENPSINQGNYYNPEKEIEKLREDNTKEIDRVNYFFIGVVVFVAITFIIQIYVTNLDRIKDKELYIKYNENYQTYSEKNIELAKEIYDQKVEINNYKNEINEIKKCVKNFGFTYKCFE